MSESTAPKLAKWPFFAGDLLLLGFAIWISRRSPDLFSLVTLSSVVVCVLGGALILILPYLIEYRAMIRFAESSSLNTAVEQIQQLNQLATQINAVTAQWQMVQDQANKSVGAAGQITDRISAEAKAFSEFMIKANDAEKAHLRLEVEKLHRQEGEMLQTLIRILDHVYALYQAGVRSGKPGLREQLGNFQNACREAVRRLGLTPFEAKTDEPFNAQGHQLLDPEAKAPADAVVAETIATGFSFQGQLLRRALVTIKTPGGPEPVAANESNENNEGEVSVAGGS